MRYWLDLFTWSTWQEFKAAGASTSGFTEKRWRTVRRMKPGDILICYLTGVSRFFALLEITGEPFKDTQPIWKENDFPSRVPVKILVELDPEHAIPVKELREELSYFQNMKSAHSWTGHFRGSPIEEQPQDAQIIISAIKKASMDPVSRPFDIRKLQRKVPLFETQNGAVTVPDEADELQEEADTTRLRLEEIVSHEEIQWQLLDLGSQIGLDVWVARNDKSKSFAGHNFANIRNLRNELPVQFDAATNRTIELIDVLWLRENAIVAAFEVEHSTTIYSGLLRMSDLVSMQPNLNIKLYIVAPDDKRDKVFSQINRPTFSRLKPKLSDICQFIPYSALREKVDQARQQGFLQYLKPEFLDDLAETFETELD